MNDITSGALPKTHAPVNLSIYRERARRHAAAMSARRPETLSLPDSPGWERPRGWFEEAVMRGCTDE